MSRSFRLASVFCTPFIITTKWYFNTLHWKRYEDFKSILRLREKKPGRNEVKGSYHEIMKWPILLILGWLNQPKGKFIWVIQQQSTVMSSLKLQQFVLFLKKASGFQNNKTKSRQYTNYWKIIKTQIIRSTLLRLTKVSVINYSIIVSQQFCHYQYYDSNSIVIIKSSIFEAFAIIRYLTKRLYWYYSINFQYFLVKVKQISVLPILDLQ